MLTDPVVNPSTGTEGMEKMNTDDVGLVKDVRTKDKQALKPSRARREGRHTLIAVEAEERRTSPESEEEIEL